ncbi:MAG: OmpA family protein [Clostridiales bacterium]|nr:OmpA family protein [Clostridiales bacterium]
MARKKKAGGGGGPNWLDTYADMVTLLLTFFVLLFAMSDINQEKFKAVIEAFNELGGVNTTSTQSADSGEIGGDSQSSAGEVGSQASAADAVENFDDIYDYLKKYIEENNLESSVTVSKGENYTFITFRKSILFNGDSYTLKPEGKQVLDFLCNGLANVSNQIEEMRFYGHTAQTEVNMSADLQAWDRELSSRRADSVLLYVQLKGIFDDPAKLISEGYGEFRPLQPHDGTEATRVVNRRVEIYLSKTGGSNLTLDEIYSDLGINSNNEEETTAANNAEPTTTSAEGTTAAEQ